MRAQAGSRELLHKRESRSLRFNRLAARSMQHVIPGCRPEPPDALNDKIIHLAYVALCPGELIHESLLAAAKRWAADRCGLLEYVTGKEKHEQPADPRRDVLRSRTGGCGTRVTRNP